MDHLGVSLLEETEDEFGQEGEIVFFGFWLGFTFLGRRDTVCCCLSNVLWYSSRRRVASKVYFSFCSVDRAFLCHHQSMTNPTMQLLCVLIFYWNPFWHPLNIILLGIPGKTKERHSEVFVVVCPFSPFFSLFPLLHHSPPRDPDDLFLWTIPCPLLCSSTGSKAQTRCLGDLGQQEPTHIPTTTIQRSQQMGWWWRDFYSSTKSIPQTTSNWQHDGNNQK